MLIHVFVLHLIELLVLDTMYLHKNNYATMKTISVYHYCFWFIYFVISIKGAALH